MECSKYIVRDVLDSELLNIAGIHKAIFNDHMLGQLPVFLIKKYYQYCFDGIKQDGGIFLLCTDCEKGDILGFVLGGQSAVFNEARKTFVRKTLLDLSFIKVLFNYKIYPFIWNRIVSGKKMHLLNELPVQPSYRLLSIGVCEKAKGTGVAELLIEAYDRIVFKHEDSYGLSVHDNNLRAINFYKNMGFKLNGAVNKSLYMIKCK